MLNDAEFLNRVETVTRGPHSVEGLAKISATAKARWARHRLAKKVLTDSPALADKVKAGVLTLEQAGALLLESGQRE